ncbi:DUF1631 family protein [Deefgea piscis]|uniref:DUF1631 family protein n=1 Tax=Deefgea piscis TaxID=2739061 RepID=A0A6M8T0Z7_9NEIS|nr:DUF1631 family protein [Deefgea piscis]QKJ67687.1 DUF1631 family protein [Deefgea piscis]
MSQVRSILADSTSAVMTASTDVDPMLLMCRDLALKMLSQSMEGFFERLEDTYFELADTTFDRKLRDDYFAAREETHQKREILAEQFKRNFLSSFNDRMSKTATADASEAGSPFYRVQAHPDQLSLVANEEYEEHLSADLIVKAFKHTGGDALTELEQRFAGLMPEQADGAINPLSPEAICDAFMQACKQLETGIDARLVALKAFENELSNQVADVYRHVNQYLIAQNVERVMPGSIKRQSHAASSFEPQAGVGAVDAALGSSVAAPMPLAAHLAHLAQAPLAENVVEAAPGWMSFLDVLQHKPPVASALNGADAAVFERNILGVLRHSGWAKNLPQMDAMTLELIALLFERMFDDARLSASIKGLIARLQIPILKVAMLDAGFFANKKHSARVLLDTLAEITLDAPDMLAGDARYDQIAVIVTQISQQFTDDIAVFDQALVALKALQDAEVAALEDALHSNAQALLQNEMAELATVTSEALVQSRLSQSDMPALVRDFLAQYWPLALAQRFGIVGENAPEFIAALKTMDDLIWSVQAKQGADARFALVNVLPGMLKSLEDIAREQGMSDAAAKSFFAELVHCHAAAIRNGLRPAVAPVAAPAELTLPSSDIETAKENKEAEQCEPLPPHSDFPIRGEWVEWVGEQNEVLRLRLSWISPKATRYLFTNRHGGNSQAFLHAELLEALNSGRIRRIQAGNSLMDQALDALKSNLK